jgi:hypothetical protein
MERLRDLAAGGETRDLDLIRVAGFRDQFQPVYFLRDKGGALQSACVQIAFGIIPVFHEVIVLAVDPYWRDPNSRAMRTFQYFLVDLFLDYYHLLRRRREQPFQSNVSFGE